MVTKSASSFITLTKAFFFYQFDKDVTDDLVDVPLLESLFELLKEGDVVG